MVIAEVEIYSANIQVGEPSLLMKSDAWWKTGYLVESRMLGGEKQDAW